MKYIRTTTPTNIYSLEPTFIVDRTDVTCFKTHGNKGRYVNDTIETEENLEKWLKFNKTSILKQADTIEELCDGFIGVHDKEWFRKNCIGTKGINYFQKPFELEYGIYKKDFANVKLKNQNGWEYTAIEWQRDEHDFIFGYVETDKGLIYVAKMNDKGELELL